MKLFIVAGARPNFMKIAPLIKAVDEIRSQGSSLEYILVHTGQHYDYNMSGSFFEQLGIPKPDIHLNSGSGTQAEQTASIMVAFEKVLIVHKPDLVIVVGDVTSTMACSISAKKLNIEVAHIEAGIRSYDNSMPEEINRLVTDSISDYFFTTTQWATDNLVNSGIATERIFLVGNTMIDTLLANLKKLTKPDFYDEQGLSQKTYFTLTLHRPSNVDNYSKLKNILNVISEQVHDIPVVFPVHPRTRKILDDNGFSSNSFILVEPMGYHDFIFTIKNCKGIITDSGGITEEATVLDIPCLTLRNTTERPETVEYGTNVLIGDDMNKLSTAIRKIINNDWKTGKVPPLWDGKTSQRITEILNHLAEKIEH